MDEVIRRLERTAVISKEGKERLQQARCRMGQHVEVTNRLLRAASDPGEWSSPAHPEDNGPHGWEVRCYYCKQLISDRPYNTQTPTLPLTVLPEGVPFLQIFSMDRHYSYSTGFETCNYNHSSFQLSLYANRPDGGGVRQEFLYSVSMPGGVGNIWHGTSVGTPVVTPGFPLYWICRWDEPPSPEGRCSYFRPLGG